MLRGIFSRQRLLAYCLAGLLPFLAATGPASASLPPRDLGQQTSFLPLCPPRTSLDTQLTDPREAEPSVTFTLSDKLPVAGLGRSPGGAPVDSLDKSSSQMTAKFQFTPAAELRVSFLYNQDQSSGIPAAGSASHLLFRYSLDYCIMPTLKVGMSGYLYKPATDYFPWRNSLNVSDPVYGVGPAIKYDLGRWSFLLRSQLEPNARDKGGEALHNWFRVWYAF